MIVMGIDVAYSSLGVCILDSNQNLLYSNAIRFNGLSSLNKKEKDLFINDDVRQLVDNVKSCSDEQKRELKDYWNNIRLRKFYDELSSLIKEYNVTDIVTESQFSEISDVFAVTRLISIDESQQLFFKAFMPSSWYKKLYGKGKLKKEIAKAHTKACIEKIGHTFKYQDQYDACALCYAYLSYKGLLSDKIKEEFKVVL